jgi:GT2 family glycosyltransferase
MGACFMTRKEIYDTLGGFDDIYFLYQEETDWEYRMTQAGWEIMILPEAKAIHDHHSSANKLGKIYVGYQGIRSIIIYYTKNFNFLKRNFLRITMIAALSVRAVKYLFIYLLKPKSLIESWKYTIKLFALSLMPRKYVLNSRYAFDI